MYGIIRILFGVALYFGAERIINRSKTSRKRLWAVLSAVFAMVFMVILAFIPFENLFFTFPSAESVYRYYHLGTAKIHLVVEGEECDYVVGSVIGSDRPYMIVPKTEKGWKIGVPAKNAFDSTKVYEDIAVTIVKGMNTSDHFIHIVDMKNETCKITDRDGLTFHPLEHMYIAHLARMDPDYWIEVNGTVIKPFESTSEDPGQTDTDFVDASSMNQNPSNTTDEKKKLTPEEALQLVKDSAQDGAEVYELYDDSPQSYKDQGKFYVIRSINPAPVELVHHGLTQFLYLVHPETGEITALDVIDEEQAIQLAKAEMEKVDYEVDEVYYECHYVSIGEPELPQYPPYYHVQVRSPGLDFLFTIGNYYFDACTGEALPDPIKEIINQREQNGK